MKIIQKFLSKSEWTRGGEKIKEMRCVVMHNVGVANQKAENVWKFWENRKGNYGSAHYIVDLNGDVYECIPESEQSYHAGSTQIDPVSERIYTDESRKRFGTKPDYNGYCPNSYSIGIELCQTDNNGSFSKETLDSAVELVAEILKRYKLGVDAISTHHNLVGWKSCPKLWTDHPALFEEFKNQVAAKLA